ncbi:hypothetical protein [Sphingobium sp.]|uniref:hypothetical protein n=1 Tax=Sphingobium sp. TaxID=1912891 RepID=UPI003B3A0B75
MVIRPLPNTDTALDLMDFINVSVAFANRPYASNPDYMSGFSVAPASPPPVTTKQVSRDRWRAGAWLLWRQDGATQADAIPGGRLGGSQAGLRVDYDLMPGAKVRTAVYGRITSAVSRPSAPESAVGLSIQPSRAIPVNIAIERRIALDPAARNANAVMAVGGFGPTPIAQSIDAEGYAQTGIVGFKRKDAFIDGKFSLSKQLPSERVRIGAAISGGAQPGASRMDIGPEIQVRLPLPQGGARLSIEWRERIAGNARPGSGLAITLAADF